MASKPTILLIHGAWHDVSCWDRVRAQLSALSYPTATVALVSPGSKPAVKSHLEDVAVVRKELEHLIEKNGKDVVLVMHSYGGLAGAGAVEGLEKVRRNAAGEQGGVVAAVFIAAFLVDKGQSLLGQFPQKPPYLIEDPDDASYCLVDNFHETFYNDLPEEASKPFVDKMRPQPISTFLSKVESTCWANGMVRCSYLFCERDQGVYPFLQDFMLKNREADSGRPWDIVKVDASHSVWLSQPEKVVQVIEQCAAT
ncbi:alpha/beta-hydrolase [Viridothelium virens]|uniref:Alpha/beta-hydrolase n=1 Tax=Viridothelium virens TaxID=1048519 RepID=A0A6A6H9Y4_VIRVR|nr:alpha/beta-hydrolase [Viridothelium virens]